MNTDQWYKSEILEGIKHLITTQVIISSVICEGKLDEDDARKLQEAYEWAGNKVDEEHSVK